MQHMLMLAGVLQQWNAFSFCKQGFWGSRRLMMANHRHNAAGNDGLHMMQR